MQTRDTTGHPRSGGRHWVLVDQAGAGAPEFSTGIFRLEPGEYPRCTATTASPSCTT